MRNKSELVESAGGSPYVGLPVGCTFCVYELEHRIGGRVPRVPIATRAVSIGGAIRQLCEQHAASRTWGKP